MSPHWRCELLISIALPVAERDGGDGPLVGAVRLDFGARAAASSSFDGLMIQS